MALGDPSLKSQTRKKLPIDGYWDEQHSQPAPFFDSKVTSTGIPRGEQRKIYDAQKARQIPENGKMLVIIDYRDFEHRKGKIVRNPENDHQVVAELLNRALKSSCPEVITNFEVPGHSNS